MALKRWRAIGLNSINSGVSKAYSMASFDYVRETKAVLAERKRVVQNRLRAMRLKDATLQQSHDDFVREHSLQTIILLSEVRRRYYGV
jgi:hypothetical protein